MRGRKFRIADFRFIETHGERFEIFIRVWDWNTHINLED